MVINNKFNEGFGELLKEGITSVANKQRKRKEIIEERIAEILGYTVHTVRRWQRGHIPEPNIVAFLVRYCVVHGRVKYQWAKSYLVQARFYGWRELLNEMFPEEEFEPFHIRHNLPQPNYEHFIGRTQELSNLRQVLCPYPSSHHHVITIGGVGGVGKSALALEIAYYYLHEAETLPPEERFEAIIWFSAKETYLTREGIQRRLTRKSTIDDLYITIAVALGKEEIRQVPGEERGALVRQALQEQRTLLILDNLETVADDEQLMAFLREPPIPTKVIVTTRHWVAVAYPIQLLGMPWEDAQQLIYYECKSRQVTLDARETEWLYKRTGGIPLAIVWSIAQMGMGAGYSVETVLRRLGQPSNDVTRFLFESSVDPLRGSDAHKLLMALTFFATDASREALRYVAGSGEDILSADEGLVTLEKLSLVNRKEGRYSMLAPTRQYVLAELARELDFDAQAFDRWVDWVIQGTDAYIEYFEGDDLIFEKARFFTTKAKERLWLLNASMNEISLEQELHWVQQGLINITQQLSPDETLRERFRFLRRLLQQRIYYEELIRLALHPDLAFEYYRIVQCSDGQITPQNATYHYLHHMYRMANKSREAKNHGNIVSVLLYESGPERNKTFAIVDDYYILIQENILVDGRWRMKGLRVIHEPTTDMLQTFEGIFRDVLNKSSPAPYERIKELYQGLPNIVAMLHQPVQQLLVELLMKGTQDWIERVAVLIGEMFEAGNETHDLLEAVLKSLLQNSEVGKLTRDLVLNTEQHNPEFANWCQARELHSIEPV